jgi:hypothetical protein
VVVVHVLGNGHEDAFIALDAVAGLNLCACENGNGYGEHECHDADGLFREDSLDPFSKIFAQKTEKADAKEELDSKKRKREVQIKPFDGFPVLDVWGEVNKEGNGYGDKSAYDACGMC